MRIGFFNSGAAIMIALFFVNILNASHPFSMASAVRQMCVAIEIYSNDHRGRLPTHLEDLDDRTYGWPDDWGLSLDSFIYVAPSDARGTPNARDSLPDDTPLIIFPYDRGIHIGYLNGTVRFIPGGFSGNRPPLWRERDRLEFQRTLLSISNLAFAAALVGFVAFQRRKKTLTNRRRQSREAGASQDA